MYKFSGDTLFLCANYQLANVPFAFYAKTKQLKLRYDKFFLIFVYIENYTDYSMIV